MRQTSQSLGFEFRATKHQSSVLQPRQEACGHPLQRHVLARCGWELLRGLGVDRGIRMGEEGRVRTQEAEATLEQA